MRVSIVTSTFNRGDQIKGLLDALGSQVFKDFELIIVNDGSTDNTSEVLNFYKDKYFYSISIIEQTNKGRSRAKNVGAKMVKNRLVIFFDDDVRPNAESVYHHVQFHRKYQKAILNGPCLYDESMFFHPFHFFRAEVEKNWYYFNRATPYEMDNISLNGGNFSILLSYFDEMGGFDESLDDKEDFKLAFDFKKKDGRLFTDTRTWAFHDDFKSLYSFIQRRRETLLAAKKMLEKYPEISQEYRHKYTYSVSNIYKFYTLKILRGKLLIKLFDVPEIHFIVTKKLLFKIFDYLITINSSMVEFKR